MRILIQGAQVVLPDEIANLNVLVDGTTIASLDPPRHVAVDQVVDAAGRWLLPGIIDDQVHFREPGLTHKEDLHSGSRACAKGGITSFLEMPNTQPATITSAALVQKLNLAATKSLVNYGFYIGATGTNLTELRRAERTPGIKIFIGSSTGDLLVDNQTILETIFAETSLPITAHCEDEQTIRANRAAIGITHNVADHSRIRDHAAAVRSTQRAIDLAIRHRHRFHVLHVSTADEADLLADHHPLITAEACPHHLLFNIDDYEELGSRIQVNPSVKTRDDNHRLWQALRTGAIQVIATDHAPHTLAEKSLPYPDSPSGLPSVENVLALMLNQVHAGRCTLLELVHWMSDAPARVWDMVDKGRIAEGYDADLVLVDLQRSQVIRDEDQVTKCGWSPWHGQQVHGVPVRTWVRGHQVYCEGTFDESKMGAEINFDHQRGGYWATQS